MRLPTFTDLYYSSPAQINNLDLTPERAVTCRIGADWHHGGWHASALTYYRAGRDIIDWIWRPEMGEDGTGRWHSEQTSQLDTYGLELSAGYIRSDGFLRHATIAYAYVTTSRNEAIIARSAMDFLRHKAVASVGVQLLRRVSLVLTGSWNDRNGSYNHYPVTGDASVVEVRDFAPYFLLDGRLSWEKGIMRIYLDVTNITDTKYCDLGAIPLPGTWFTGGLTITVH